MRQVRLQHVLAATLLLVVAAMPSARAQRLVTDCPPNANVSALRFIIQTGSNDLRGSGDNVYALVQVLRRPDWRPLPADSDGLNHDARWSAWSVHAVDIPIPPATGGCPVTPPEIFTGVRLQTQFTGPTAIDAWDLQSVLVYWVGVDEHGVPASGLIAHNRSLTRTTPLHRFILASANYDVPMGH